MLDVEVPGFKHLKLTHLVTDYNGTLAVDGKLLPGVKEALIAVAKHLEIHVVTADTFGIAGSQLEGLPVLLTITPPESQADAKLAFVAGLGSHQVVAIGNGRNDRKMMKAAALSISLIQKEGASLEALSSADIVSRDIVEALELFLNPKRLIATLRS